MTDLPIDWDGPAERTDACGPRCFGVTCCGPRWAPEGDCPCMGETDHSDCPVWVGVERPAGERDYLEVVASTASAGARILAVALPNDRGTVTVLRDARATAIAVGTLDTIRDAVQRLGHTEACALVEAVEARRRTPGSDVVMARWYAAGLRPPVVEVK